MVSYEKGYDDQGRILSSAEFLNGELHGEAISYFDSKRKVMYEKPRVTYYLHNKRASRDKFLAQAK